MLRAILYCLIMMLLNILRAGLFFISSLSCINFHLQALLSHTRQNLGARCSALAKAPDKFGDGEDLICRNLVILEGIARAQKDKLLIRFSAARSGLQNGADKDMTEISAAAKEVWQPVLREAIFLMGLSQATLVPRCFSSVLAFISKANLHVLFF